MRSSRRNRTEPSRSSSTPDRKRRVVVITGASSGIGRAAAFAFAERGDVVFLAARSGRSLQEVVRECAWTPGTATSMSLDVADEDQVQELARRAVETFGRIDVWVNAAAVMAYGHFEELPSAVYRRVLETNLFGQIHGARAALPHFRSQGSGVLVNVGSVWGAITSPYVSSYVVSKFGVRALTECLREALRLEGLRDVHVTTILPQVESLLLAQLVYGDARGCGSLCSSPPGSRQPDAGMRVADGV